MHVPRSTAKVAAVAVLALTVWGVAPAMTAAPSLSSSIVTLDPSRILDTREPIGVPAVAKVGANSSITVQAAGIGGVPAMATGVIVTLTAVNATQPTFVTATPTGSTRSTTSVLNPSSSQPIANTITIGLGTNGQFDLYNLAGTVDLIADVSGYLLPSGPAVMTESIELSAYSGAGIGVGLPNSVGCVDLGNSGTLFLDIPLPHGAVVTSVDFRWFDNDTANFLMALSEVNGAPFTVPTSGNVVGGQTQSTGSSGFGVSSVQIAAGDEVSGSVRYQILVLTTGQASASTSHQFCGVTVTYSRVVS